MKRRQQQAFSLIELMAVVVIIGILSALAIPGIMKVRYRNALTSTTAEFRTAAAMVRDMALQTRQAVVLEVTETSAWINLLGSPNCWDPIGANGQLCTTPMGPSFPFVVPGSTGQAAGVAMCGGVALTLGGTDCDTPVTLSASNGFALCYDGAGDLWYRLGPDGTMVCGGSGNPSITSAGWKQPCNTPAYLQQTFADGVTSGLRDGAAIMFNRYEGTACSAPAEDVARFVVFPTSGMPYTTLAVPLTGGDTDSD